MPFDQRKEYTPDDAETLLEFLEDAATTAFGTDYYLGHGSPIGKLIEAYGLLPVSQYQSDLLEALRQAFPATATGENLKRVLFVAKKVEASRATGTVNVTLKSAITTPSPLFTAESLVFYDADGNQFENTEDVLPNGTTSIAIKVRAVELGSEGNIAASQIIEKAFRSTTSSTNWTTNVASFTNSAAFTGGADEEEDTDYLRRFREQLAAIPSSSLDGIIAACGPDNVEGVTSVDGDENLELVSSADENLFTHSGTGSNKTVNGTDTRVGQKFTPAKRRFVQDVKIDVAVDTSFVGIVRIETDSAGSPSGTLAHANLTKAWTPGGTGIKTIHFDLGAYLSGSTAYWLVVERTSGSADIVGSTTGTANQVKLYNGSWVDATPDNLKVDVIAGLPGRSFRIWVRGGAVNDIAQAIQGSKSAGMRDDGHDSGTAKDKANRNVTRYFERPTEVDIYVNVTIKKDTTFSSDADGIKDIIIAHIGGTTVDGDAKSGLGVSEELVYYRLKGLFSPEAGLVTGVKDVTVLQVGKTASPVGTSNITAAKGEKFITAPAKIAVTLTDA